MYNNNLQYRVFFGHIHLFRFIILMNLLNLYFFGHIHRVFGQVQWLMYVGVIFWSRSNVHVRWYDFFWSYSNPFSVILNGSK